MMTLNRAIMRYTINVLFSVVLTSLLLNACQNVGSSSTASQPLQANAGEDIAVKVGNSPTFDGCASTGAITNYQWKIVTAPDAMAEYDGKVIREIENSCSYTLEASMLVEEVGMWEVELEVKDSAGNTSTDNVNVDVEQ